MCALAVLVGVRVVGLAQVAVALPTALHRTTSVPLFVGVLVGYVAESAALAAVAIRARAYRNPWWGWADTATAAAVLLAQPAFVAPADTTGSWTAWGFALTLGTAAGSAIVFPRRRDTALAVAVLVGAYLVSTLPHTSHTSATTTVVSNAFAYAGFAVLTRLLAGYLRRLAHDAETARREAAAAAAEAARLAYLDSQRLLLHDNIGTLRLLAQPDLPADLTGALRIQAIELANRVRAFLDDVSRLRSAPDTAARDGEQVPLTDAVRAAIRTFGDLPLEISLDLATGVMLPSALAETLTRAVHTLLANVRLHANADLVVVHGDTDDLAGWWEITVHDNGRGFDPATTPRGFGLREQVETALAAHSTTTHIHSTPGDGTTITLRGPREETP